MAGIMDMFNTFLGAAPQPTQQVQQAPAQPTPGNIPAQTVSATLQNQQTPANGVIPNQTMTSPAQPGTTPTLELSPLDQFKDIWDKPAAPTTQQAGMFNVDNAKLMEAASRVDFSKAVTPEIVARMAAGGEDAIKASMEAMSKMSQLSYAQSALATTKIVEQALNQAQGKFESQIPDLIRKHNVGDSLRTENPALSHPAAQPILEALQSQFTQKHPQATVQEINTMVKEYFTAFASSVTPKPKEDISKGTKLGEQDWTSFL